MRILSLNGTWFMKSDWMNIQIMASVPGSVYTDLLNSGEIPDPFWRDNEMKILPLMEYDYRYTRDFEISEDVLSYEHIYLRCYGLDTLAGVEINGEQAGMANKKLLPITGVSFPFWRKLKSQSSQKFCFRDFV